MVPTCGHYRRLNLVTTPDKYPLPNMQDLSNGLHSCTIFSKIVLVKGYHQIPVATEDIPKTAIIVPFGLFEYLFTPFWTVQRRTNISENDGLCHRWFGRCVCIYGWRACRFSGQAKPHLHHLEAFFKTLATNGLAINLEKCMFATPSLEILGHTISATGASPTADQAGQKKIAHPLRISRNCNVSLAW